MDALQGTRRGHRVERGLGSRFRSLWWGQAISQIGDYVAYTTLPLFVAQLGDSTLDFAVTYALESVPVVLFGLVGGVLLDRLSLRSVMITADLVRAATFFGLGFLALNPSPSALSLVFVLAFVSGTFSATFQNGLYAMLPALVAGDDLTVANGRIAISQQVALVVGPALAGAMAATVGLAPGFAINGLSFLVSAISVWLVGRIPPRVARDQRTRFLEEAAHGLRFLWSEPRLRASTLAAAAANGAVGFIESTLVVLATQVLGAEESSFGLMLATLGIGGIVGATVAPRVARMIGLGRAMTVGLIIFGLAFWALIHQKFGGVALFLLFAIFLGISLVNVPLVTIRQTYTPPAMLGRVITAARTIGWSTLPIGSLLGAALADGTSYFQVARFTPAVLIAAGLWLTLTPIWSDTEGPHRGRRILKQNGKTQSRK
ncbi:MAG: MFS transporter [Acidimicrobiia bacterium]|nr:MFS transporter [Acidimicrobiia bacterium]